MSIPGKIANQLITLLMGESTQGNSVDRQHTNQTSLVVVHVAAYSRAAQVVYMNGGVLYGN